MRSVVLPEDLNERERAAEADPTLYDRYQEERRERERQRTAEYIRTHPLPKVVEQPVGRLPFVGWKPLEDFVLIDPYKDYVDTTQPTDPATPADPREDLIKRLKEFVDARAALPQDDTFAYEDKWKLLTERINALQRELRQLDAGLLPSRGDNELRAQFGTAAEGEEGIFEP